MKRYKRSAKKRTRLGSRLRRLFRRIKGAATSFLQKIFRKDRRTDKRKTGDIGEELAVEYLKKNYYVIMARNWRHGKNEIDIIAKKNNTVAFIEVKTTASDAAESYKMPLEAIDREKRRHITECARVYVGMRKGLLKEFYDEDNRFDVIEVYLNRETPEINHIQDAFFAEKGNKRRWKT